MDRALACTTAKTKRWYQANFPVFLAKGVWSGNSPDLSPIENIWVIISRKRSTSEPDDVRGHPHRKRPFGLIRHLDRDAMPGRLWQRPAGQPEEQDARQHDSLCGEAQ